MKQFKGYEEAREKANFNISSQIPSGAYVCEIKDVKFDESQVEGNSDAIIVFFDIIEGDQKDFFKKQYDSNISEDKKWKGKVKIWCPVDDGSEKDGWTVNNFAKWTAAFEKSNSGYIWDWDEKKWKNKKIGIVFGPTGTVIDGKEVVYTEVHGCCSVDDVHNNSFYKGFLDLKKKNGYTGTSEDNSKTNSNTEWNNVPDDSSEDFPFN